MSLSSPLQDEISNFPFHFIRSVTDRPGQYLVLYQSRDPGAVADISGCHRPRLRSMGWERLYRVDPAALWVEYGDFYLSLAGYPAPHQLYAA